MYRFNVIFKKCFQKTHRMNFFVQHVYLDSSTQVDSSVSEISNPSNIDEPQLVLSLFHPPIFGLFCLISCSLAVVASDPIYSHTNHLQYHVILICVFLWNKLFRNFNWDFWNNLFILKLYILQSSMKLCSKAFIQQPIKYMVVPR